MAHKAPGKHFRQVSYQPSKADLQEEIDVSHLEGRRWTTWLGCLQPRWRWYVRYARPGAGDRWRGHYPI